jgi:glycosyltransferase involved in cell wall biosynthesis
VERLAQALADRGHEGTVLTSQFDRDLPRLARMDGVTVVRAPVALRVSKGVVMPSFGWLATQLTRQNEIVHLHLPQFDAPGLALRGRVSRRPVVLTYHCDLRLPPGGFNRLVNRVVLANNWLAGRLADAVVTYTDDYARHSPFLYPLLGKVHVIPPPVVLPAAQPGAIEAFAERWGLTGKPIIGMAARLATEKGVEVLLEALPRILDEFPRARVLFAGPYQHVLGEEEYARHLQPRFEALSDHWTFVGSLRQRDMAAFYSNCDLTVLPSLNSTESFGLVQVEGMLLGVPAVASDLPGVRQPVRLTGMGEIAPVGDPDGLAESILRVLRQRERYTESPAGLEGVFAPDQTARCYEALFARLMSGAPPGDGDPDPYAGLRRDAVRRESEIPVTRGAIS